MKFARELAFRDAIQDAKRRLSAELLGSWSASDEFTWHGDGPKFRVVVGRVPNGDILPVHRRDLQRLTAPPNARNRTAIIERRPSDPNAACLVIEGWCDRDGRVSDPCIVLELLGRVMPRLLAREAVRQRLPTPHWIVTGRAALWPPLFEAITATAREFGGRAPPRPFNPAEMKAAVLR